LVDHNEKPVPSAQAIEEGIRIFSKTVQGVLSFMPIFFQFLRAQNPGGCFTDEEVTPLAARAAAAFGRQT